MTRKERAGNVGFGMTGSGAVLVAISMLVDDGYWFLLVGTVFVVIGASLYAYSRMTGWSS